MSKKKKSNIVTKKNKVGRPLKYNWQEIEIQMLILARVGYKTPYQMSKIIGIPKSTIERYINSNKEFAEKLKQSDVKFFGMLLSKMIEQVKRGYFPAIQYLMEKSFKNFDKILEESNEEGLAKKETLTITIEKYDTKRLKDEIDLDISEEESVEYTDINDLGENIDITDAEILE